MEALRPEWHFWPRRPPCFGEMNDVGEVEGSSFIGLGRVDFGGVMVKIFSRGNWRVRWWWKVRLDFALIRLDSREWSCCTRGRVAHFCGG